MEVDFCTLGNHEFDVGDQAVANAWTAARDNALRYGVDHSLPQLLVSNLFIKYDAEGHEDPLYCGGYPPGTICPQTHLVLAPTAM